MGPNSRRWFILFSFCHIQYVTLLLSSRSIHLRANTSQVMIIQLDLLNMARDASKKPNYLIPSMAILNVSAITNISFVKYWFFKIVLSRYYILRNWLSWKLNIPRKRSIHCSWAIQTRIISIRPLCGLKLYNMFFRYISCLKWQMLIILLVFPSHTGFYVWTKALNHFGWFPCQSIFRSKHESKS